MTFKLLIKKAISSFLFFLFTLLNLSCSPFAREREGLYWAGWLAYWDFASATESFSKHADWYEEMSLFLYSFSQEGSIYQHPVDSDLLKKLRHLAKRKKVRLIPTIVNDVVVRGEKARLKDGNFIHQILIDERKRLQHIKDIVELVNREHFDGIDIDYENLNPEDKENFLVFLSELKKSLHKTRKKLVVTLEPKERDVAFKGPGANDWQTIGLLADQVRIMCYNFHYANSEPGPIAPLEWIKAVTLYAVEKIPPEKIVIGLPFFGIDWIEERKGKSFTTTQILSHLASQNIQSTKDPAFSSLYYRYTDAKGLKREVWYEDAQTIQEKMTMIEGLGIHRFIFWRIGGEDPRIYQSGR